MSYLSQMAGLAWHNFISAAAGIAIAIALARGITRRGERQGPRHDRQLLGRSHARHRLRPAADQRRLRAGARLAGRDPEPRSLRGGARRSRAPSRRSRMGPVASQEAIKQLGTNGGGFFNANSAHPFENPTPAHELPLDVPDLRDPRRAHLHVRPHGAGPAAGLGALRRDGVPVLRGRRRSPTGRRRRATRSTHALGVATEPREHGRQGGPLRRRQLRPLRHGHHRRLVRRRQLDARQLHAARRPGAAVQHPARRGHLRRRRRRALRRCWSWRSCRSSSPA